MRLRFASYLSAAVLSVNAWPMRAQTVMNFVSMPPCRVIETRDPSYGAFGSPFLAAKSSRDFAIPAGSCGVPSGALAYSFNITVIPHGSLPYLTMWPTGQQQPGVSTLNSYGGAVLANAAIVPAGTNGSISVYVAGDTDLIVDINGYFVSQSIALDQLNQQIGQINQQITQLNQQITQQGSQFNQQIVQLNQQVSPLANQVSQISQQAAQVSQQAAQVSQQFGQFTQQITQINQVLTDVHSDAARQGVALGAETAVAASQNTAIGYTSLQANSSGNGNTALGSGALVADRSGSNNVALGAGSLSNTLTGNANIAVGNGAGNSVGDSSNSIEIGNSGQANDNGVIRIGTPNVHQSTFIAGITGSTVDVGDYVLVDENGQLGTFQSSARYKEQIQDVGSASDALLALRPVRFRYKQPNINGDKPVQYGLVAEEVEKIMPELVLHNRQGEVEGVQYHQLPALMLKELQKQHQIMTRQQKQIQNERREVSQLRARIAALEAQAKPSEK